MENDELIYEIDKLNNYKYIIIVEGKKDRITLEKLGIKNNIIELSKKPIYKIIEEIASQDKECIILTDFDKKGKQLYGKLNSGLTRLGVKVNNKFREFLQKNTKISHIEGLYSYLINNS